MKSRYVLWGFVCTGLFGLAYVTTPDGPIFRPPVIDLPEHLELGERELGEIVVAPLAISNRGGRDLLIDEISGNLCSCSGLEQQEGEGFRRFESLTIRPGETMNLVVRVAVRGRPGEPQTNDLSLRTNEIGQPRRFVRIHVARVTGVAITPSHVLLGDLLPGTEGRQVVEVRDVGQQGLELVRVESTDPERFEVRPQPGGTAGEDESASLGRLVARCEVIARAREVGTLSGHVRFHLTRPGGIVTAEVPVSGRIVAAVVATPSQIVLPRASTNGPLYHALCLCRNRLDGPLTLTVESASEGLSASVLPTSGPAAVRQVRIEFDPSHGTPEARTAKVRLKAFGNGVETPVEIAVSLPANGGAR
jgi:hypothetical protein